MFSIPLIKSQAKSQGVAVLFAVLFSCRSENQAKSQAIAVLLAVLFASLITKRLPLKDSLRNYWIIRLMSMIPIMSRLPYTTWPLVDDAWITVPSPTYIATWPQ